MVQSRELERKKVATISGLYCDTGPSHLVAKFIKKIYILTKCRVNLRLSELNDVPKYRRFFQSYVKNPHVLAYYSQPTAYF